MKLTIKNFQGHEQSTLDFTSPGINAITGPNGHGKSSIFRAMRAVPMGDTLDRRHNTRESSVDIDGVTKAYTSARNQYEIDGNTFKALRNNVPKEVFDRLQLRDINFRSQHQPYFLLSDSPGAVARAMNELTDLGVIDYVASALKSEGRRLDAERSRLESNLEAERTKVSSLDWAVEANEDLRLIESTQASIDAMSTQILTLSVIIADAVELRAKLAKFPPAGVLQVFECLLDKIHLTDSTGLEALISTATTHKQWIESVPESMMAALEVGQNRLSKAPEIASLESLVASAREYALDLRLCLDPKPDIARLDFAFPEYDLLETRVAEARRLRSEVERLSHTAGWGPDLSEIRLPAIEFESLEALSKSAASLLQQSIEVELKYQEALSDYKLLMPETCPLCGGVTNEDHQH